MGYSSLQVSFFSFEDVPSETIARKFFRSMRQGPIISSVVTQDSTISLEWRESGKTMRFSLALLYSWELLVCIYIVDDK